VSAKAACGLLPARAGTNLDASEILANCLKSLQPGERLALLPGTYRLTRPIVIRTPVTITTSGVADEAPGCGELPESSCATLLLDIDAGAAKAHSMPVEIAAGNVHLIHLVIRGAGPEPRRRSSCRSASMRPLGGGTRVSSSGFSIRKSVLRDMTCYSALEITKGADHIAVAGNLVGPNGDHGTQDMWSDGVTIHDSAYTSVVDNLFVDNTDVQLIFGGCRNCRIERNQFLHRGGFSSASFAELMLHSWPGTSGAYDATLVEANRIDCGSGRRCGYGIMLGSAPWYPGRASGGSIVSNSIADAMIAINIDSLSGPVEIRDNIVRSSGGRFDSDCGYKQWPAVNIGPGSRRFVRGDVSNLPDQSIATSGCLLNRRP
jgi:hypothetical protein